MVRQISVELQKTSQRCGWGC